MTHKYIFSKASLLDCNVADEIRKAFAVICARSPEEYNSKLFHDLALGFRIIVYDMDKGSSDAFPWFLKWLKMYVKMQHQIDPKNEALLKKFEKKIPVCTSYILASLQYQTKIANYHLEAMEMCLTLLNATSPKTMQIISHLDQELISLLWMPIEFTGDYNTQKMSLKLIVKVLQHVSETSRETRLTVMETSQDIKNLILKLVEEGDDSFERNSRNLLNKFNMEITKSCAVFSVHCTAVHFGSFKLSQPDTSDKFWIDFNYMSKSVSFLCKIKKEATQQEELSITIKIDKLQIENQFDCIVVSTEPAQFSIPVTDSLQNARIAIFTLPPSEVERLKANKDLLDFYNTSYESMVSESNRSPSLNTIDDFLAQDVAIDETMFDNLQLNEIEAPTLDQESNPIDVAKFQILPTAQVASETQDSNKTQLPIVNQTENKETCQQSQPKGNQKRSESTMTNSKQKKSNAKNATYSPMAKESGYNTGASPQKQNQTVFRRPRRASQLKVKPPAPPKKVITSFIQNQKSLTKESQKPSQKLSASQPITMPRKQSRRFIKQPSVAPGGEPPSSPNKARRSRRRKPANKSTYYSTSNTDTNAPTEIIPKRKQVNILKPLNHLTKPDCDPEEAALEFVENGGYSNIVNFIRSKTGSTCFSDKQRKQILQNIERINEELERRTNTYFSNKNPYSDSDGGSIWRPPAKRMKQKPTKDTVQVNSFVPYSKWRTRQKNTTKTPKDAFDKLKISETKRVTAVSNEQLRTNTPATARTNSETSSSNHNFQIAESDDDLVDATAKQRASLSLSDLQCRQQSTEMDGSPVPAPNELSHDSFQCGEMPLESDSLVFLEHDSFKPDTTTTAFINNYAPTPLATCQMSEIFEDIDELPPPDSVKETPQPRPISYTPSETEKNPVEIISIDSTSSIEQASLTYSQTNSQQIPFDVHTESDPNFDLENTWIIEKYLTDQRLYSKTTCSRHESHSPPASSVKVIRDLSKIQPQNITTNQVIIQNQFVVSSLRSLSSATDHISMKDYSQLLPTYMDRVMKEKSLVLKQLECKLDTNFFDKIDGMVDEVMKSITDHETAINEAQEQLSAYLKKLENLIQGQIENRAQLEEIHRMLLDRLRSSIPDTADVEMAYEEAADKLKNYANGISGDLWQSFAGEVVYTIEDRLRKLVDL